MREDEEEERLRLLEEEMDEEKIQTKEKTRDKARKKEDTGWNTKIKAEENERLDKQHKQLEEIKNLKLQLDAELKNRISDERERILGLV